MKQQTTWISTLLIDCCYGCFRIVKSIKCCQSFWLVQRTNEDRMLWMLGDELVTACFLLSLIFIE